MKMHRAHRSVQGQKGELDIVLAHQGIARFVIEVKTAR